MPRRRRKFGSPKRHLEALRLQEEKEQKQMTKTHTTPAPLASNARPRKPAPARTIVGNHDDPANDLPPVTVAPAGLAVMTDEPAYITVAELAAQIGAAHSTVQKRARDLGATKKGKTILLTRTQANVIRAALSNPEKAGPKTRASIEADGEAIKAALDRKG